MRELKTIAVTQVERDPAQPRMTFIESELIDLGGNMKAHGQQVPIIVYSVPPSGPAGPAYRLLDGERRWRAAQLAGIAELDALILSRPPSAAELGILQMSLEAHKSSLTAMERSHLLHRIRNEKKWGVTETAENLSIPQSVVSKLLALQKLDAPIQAMVHDGRLDVEKAFIISQQADPQKQQELLKVAPDLTRDQLRQRTKAAEGSAARAATARFALANGMSITIQGKEVTLDNVIEAMAEAVKELKRGQNQGLDITTAQRVMKDKARTRS